MSGGDGADIRLLVVDDQAVIRTGLGVMLDSEPGLVVVAEAANGAEAVEQASRHHPDVVLMDIRMPVLDGVEATRRIVAAGSAGAVVVLTTFDDEEYLLESVRAGAFGFLLKDAGPDLLAAAVRTAHRGDTLIDPSMTRTLLEARLRPPPDAAEWQPDAASAARLATLSPRELDVLAALARGLGNAQIAAELWVSEATVKSHLSSLLTKTGTASRVQAAVFAYESGFVRPGSSGRASEGTRPGRPNG